jgi:sec-independent protein translocase protein TatA
MFGIGFQEMLLILVVVLIFFGPKRLPDLAKSLGKGLAEFKKASEEVKKSIDEAMKEEAPKEEAAKEEAAKEEAAKEEATPRPPVSQG